MPPDGSSNTPGEWLAHLLHTDLTEAASTCTDADEAATSVRRTDYWTWDAGCAH
jgi:hypothetical protein